MKTDEVIVKDVAGIHARPASLLVKSAKRFDADVFLEYDNKKANAKSIMALMKLGVKGGEKVKVWAEGADEEIAVSEIVKSISTNFK
ncbi:HPr family phosphocarrier protein [Vibrio barjaei]|uniref:HPr family phosphocarrier protein n=1 Tax=Vibrio barjaei TaxID=1676683 RepID=UPI0007BB6E5C|nr:HPr family phosphocarrier protein [Vibrio barjaei]OIN27672.1 PTS sugar transporter subunit IIA [Vibrio barjaei]